MQDQLYLQSTTTIDRIPQHSLSLPEKLARLKAAEQHYYAIRMKMYGADLIDDIRAWVTELRDAKAEVEYWRDSAGGHSSGSGSHGGS